MRRSVTLEHCNQPEGGKYQGGSSADTAKGLCRKEECTICLYCKESHKTGDWKICGEYIIEDTIHNKMRLDKCDAYTGKESRGYRERKSYWAVTIGTAKGEEN